MNLNFRRTISIILISTFLHNTAPAQASVVKASQRNLVISMISMQVLLFSVFLANGADCKNDNGKTVYIPHLGSIGAAPLATMAQANIHLKVKREALQEFFTARGQGIRSEERSKGFESWMLISSVLLIAPLFFIPWDALSTTIDKMTAGDLTCTNPRAMEFSHLIARLDWWAMWGIAAETIFFTYF